LLSRVSSTKLDDSELITTPDGEVPTDLERKTLRLVSDRIPLAAWLVCIVETAERFAYYGMAGPLRMFDLPIRK
jgi:proton-dependent oligopeptide transporter, POT family